MKQTVGNACGTIALIHAVANNLDRYARSSMCYHMYLTESCNYFSIDLADGHLKTFLEATKTLNPEEKASKLEIDEGLSTAHEESAQTGQTAAPDRDEKVDLHFVAMVEKDGLLYELGIYFEF